MEEELDEIEEGKLAWTDALHEFYETFARDLKAFEQYVKGRKQQAIPTDEVCENCGSPMVIKLGRFGQFLACSNYPECRTTREVAKPATADGDGASTNASADGGGESIEETCELCGKPMAMKRGRFGPFLGCTGYPECRNIRRVSKKTGAVAPAPVPVEGETCPVDGAQLVRRHGPYGEFVSCANYPACKYIKRETTGIACPRAGCRGEIVVKKSKRGKVFYGCSEYPKCDVVYWDKPVADACPKCNAPFLLEKTTKKGTTRSCAREDCDYKQDVHATTAPPTGAETSGDAGRVAR